MDGGNRVLDDLAKLATSAVGVLQGAGREAEELMRQRLERLLDRMDLVKRDEFDAVKAMAVAAREENERLARRLEELDAMFQQAQAAAKKPVRRTAGSRKSGGKKAGSTPKRAAKSS